MLLNTHTSCMHIYTVYIYSTSWELLIGDRIQQQCLIYYILTLVYCYIHMSGAPESLWDGMGRSVRGCFGVWQ